MSQPVHSSPAQFRIRALLLLFPPLSGPSRAQETLTRQTENAVTPRRTLDSHQRPRLPLLPLALGPMLIIPFNGWEAETLWPIPQSGSLCNKGDRLLCSKPS